MKYYRIKTSDKDGIVSGQILSPRELESWLEMMHRQNYIETLLDDGFSFSISLVKKSPLLTNKKKS